METSALFYVAIGIISMAAITLSLMDEDVTDESESKAEIRYKTAFEIDEELKEEEIKQ